MNIRNMLMDLYIEKNGKVITPELAKGFVYEMAVTDGSDRTSGEKWTMDDAKMVGDKYNVDWNSISKCEWYVVLNMMYSDYYRTGKKHGFIDSGFYAELASDWFSDVDASPDKTFNYFMFD